MPRPTDELAAAARWTQETWGSGPLGDRLRIVRSFRHALVRHADEIADLIHVSQRTSRAETISAELIPLADACRFLERNAKRILAPRRPGRRGRPAWLNGSDLELRREPYGVVLIIGPSNYPLLLPGIQLMQAIVAGNAVLLKPGRAAGDAAARLCELIEEAGVPPGLVACLDESPESAQAAMRSGVDKVVLTGARETGVEVMRELAETLTPSVMELSGCDAVFVREDADLNLTARALCFGTTFNGGFTCIAPRRVFVARSRQAELEKRLVELLTDVAPIPVMDRTRGRLNEAARAALGAGARLCSGRVPVSKRTPPLVFADLPIGASLMREDFGAPLLCLVPVDDDERALALAAECGYELGASIFGSASGAEALATRARAGVVVVNDMIVPTADPRVPFGGRGASGFGVTRGAEGLLELTRPKAILRRRGKFRPHFDPVGPREERLLAGYLTLAHGSTLTERGGALLDLLRSMIARKS